MGFVSSLQISQNVFCFVFVHLVGFWLWFCLFVCLQILMLL